MTKLTIKAREELMEEYVNLANATANTYNESYRNLSNALLTASSIYMAVIAAIVASQDSVASLDCCQLYLLGTSALIFLISILVGIASHMSNVSMSKKMYLAYVNAAKALIESDAETERKNITDECEKVINSRKDTLIIIAQLVLFTIGTILIMPPFYVVLANNWLSGQF